MKTREQYQEIVDSGIEFEWTEERSVYTKSTGVIAIGIAADGTCYSTRDQGVTAAAIRQTLDEWSSQTPDPVLDPNREIARPRLQEWLDSHSDNFATMRFEPVAWNVGNGDGYWIPSE